MTRNMRRVRIWNIVIVAAIVFLEWCGFSQGHQCWNEVPVNDTDCTAFQDFCYLFEKYPHNRTAILVLDLRRHVADLLVRMRSADCDFRCATASSAPCNLTTVATSEPSRVEYAKDFFRQYYAFNNITSRNFCVTVSLSRCNKFNNAIHTITEGFEAAGSVSASPVRVAASRRPSPVIPVCMAFAGAALLAVAAYCAKAHLCRLRLRGAVPLEEQLDSKVSCSPPLLAAARHPRAAAILLLYSRDSDAFVRLMEAFRKLLAALTGLQVVDPLDGRVMEQVFPGPVGWLSRQLRRPDVRVVLVVSAGALARQRALNGGRTPHPPPTAAPHALDFLFTHALRDMQNDYRIGGDYRRVFKVRFEDITTTTETLSHIVPMREYRLMRHIGRLVHEIRGETHPPDNDDIAHSQELLRNVPEADSLFAILQEVTGTKEVNSNSSSAVHPICDT